MHSPRALAPRGGAPLAGLATPPPKGGLCSFCLLITREGACPLSGWLGGVRGGMVGSSDRSHQVRPSSPVSWDLSFFTDHVPSGLRSLIISLFASILSWPQLAL